MPSGLPPTPSPHAGRGRRPVRVLPARRPRRGGVNWKKQGILLGGMLLVTATGLLLLRPALLRVQMKANEHLAVQELIEFQSADAKFASQLNMGGFVSPEIVANPRRYPIEGILFLSPRFVLSTRNGYRFEFRGEGDVYQCPIQPAYENYVYSARPLIRGQTGVRSFAVYGSDLAVFARSDGEIPTKDDEVIRPTTR